MLEPAVLDYIDGDDTVWEQGPLERLAAEGHLAAYRHAGFWQPMDTLRDRNLLEDLWRSGHAAWHVWADDPAPAASPAPVPRRRTQVPKPNHHLLLADLQLLGLQANSK